MGNVERGDGTVGKALEILDLVAGIGRPVRFGELQDRSPFPKATLYRFLQTLTNQGMLVYDSQAQTYSLGLRLVGLAHSAWQQTSLAPIAKPFIEELAQKVGETVHLAQFDGGQVLFVDKRRATNQFETMAEVGRVAPAYCTGVGKAILAFLSPERRERALLQQAFFKYTAATHESSESLLVELEEIRRTGVAHDREEHEQGIVSLAAPILADNNRVFGAISVATSISRKTSEQLDSFAPDIQDAARKIGQAATNWQFPTMH